MVTLYWRSPANGVLDWAVAAVRVAGQAGLQTPDGQAIPLKGGTLSGLIQATSLVSGYQADLDTLAANVIAAVNLRHAAGAGLDAVVAAIGILLIRRPAPARLRRCRDGI